MMNPKVKSFVAGLMITLICFFMVISTVGRFTALSYGMLGNAEPHTLSVDGGEYGEPQVAFTFVIAVIFTATLFMTAVYYLATDEGSTNDVGGPEMPERGSIADLRLEYQQIEYTDVLMAQLD